MEENHNSSLYGSNVTLYGSDGMEKNYNGSLYGSSGMEENHNIILAPYMEVMV